MKEIVLLIGGAGYIGSHIAWSLYDEGSQVLVLDDFSTGSDQFLPSCDILVEDITRIKLDRLASWRGRVSAVIHLAALTSVPESLVKPEPYYSTNVFGTLCALNLAKYLKAKDFIFSSTAAVYGVPNELPISESHPVQPLNPYGSSKLAAEMVVRDYCQAHGLHGVILRYFNVAGCDPEMRTGDTRGISDNLIHQLIRCVDNPESIFVINGNDYNTPDGTAVRDFVHVSDVADAHVRAMKLPIESRPDLSVLNIGYGKGYSVKQIVESLRQIIPERFDPIVECSTRRSGDIGEIWADNTALVRVGWKPRFNNLYMLLKHNIEWHDYIKGMKSRI